MKKQALLTALAVALPLALAQAPAQARDLTVVNFGGANGDAQNAAFIQPYEKETGKKVIPVAYNGEQAKVKAAELALLDLLRPGGDMTVPEDKLRNAIQGVEQARSRITVARAHGYLKARQLLTPEQQQRVHPPQSLLEETIR